MTEGFYLKCGCLIQPGPTGEWIQFRYCAQHNSFTLHEASPGNTADWIGPAPFDHFIAARAAKTPVELEEALANARAELTESEYSALLGGLSSASNKEYERTHRRPDPPEAARG